MQEVLLVETAERTGIRYSSKVKARDTDLGRAGFDAAFTDSVTEPEELRV